jgi:putative chitinase
MLYFTLDELLKSYTAERLGIDNKPSADVLVNLNDTMVRMSAVRSLLGYPVHVNSGFRCEALEKILCQEDYKNWCIRHGLVVNEYSWYKYFSKKGHPKGFSVDFTCNAFGSPRQIVDKIKENPSIKYDQLIMEGSWVHISFAPEMRSQSMVATFNNGVPTYKMES